MKLSDIDLEMILGSLTDLYEGTSYWTAERRDLVSRLKTEQRLREMAATTPERWNAVKDELHRVGHGKLPENWRELVAAYSEDDVTRFVEASAAGGVRAPRKASIKIGSVDALEALLGGSDFDLELPE